MNRSSFWPASAVVLWTLFGAGHLSTHAAATYADMVRARKDGKPNIILIVVDSLTADDLGAYTQKVSHTPRTDR